MPSCAHTVPRTSFLLLLTALGNTCSDSSSNGEDADLAQPEMLENSALREFASLPAGMGPAAAARRSAAVRLARKHLNKKVCKKSRRVGCALRLATELAADGQHAEAVETAKAALLGQKGHGGSVAEPFALFWLAQHAAHVGTLSDPDRVLEEAGAMLFERMTELQEPPDLLNCVGLLEPQPRAQQIEACSGAVEKYCADDDQLSLLPCRVSLHWAGLLQLDSVLGGLLPDGLSPTSPSDEWRDKQPGRRVLRSLSMGCASLAAAASGGNAEPGLLKANYSCALLQAATESRRRDSLGRRISAYATEFKPIRRIDAKAVGSDLTNAGKGKTLKMSPSESAARAVIEQGEPIVLTGSSALGLGERLTLESIRAMCGDHPLGETESAYLGAPSVDSVSSAATPLSSNERAGQWRLRDGLLASRDAVRTASLRGAPVGVSGWAVAACPSLARMIEWPEFAMTARRNRDERAHKPAGADHEVCSRQTHGSIFTLIRTYLPHTVLLE